MSRFFKKKKRRNYRQRLRSTGLEPAWSMSLQPKRSSAAARPAPSGGANRSASGGTAAAASDPLVALAGLMSSLPDTGPAPKGAKSDKAIALVRGKWQCWCWSW